MSDGECGAGEGTPGNGLLDDGEGAGKEVVLPLEIRRWKMETGFGRRLQRGASPNGSITLVVCFTGKKGSASRHAARRRLVKGGGSCVQSEFSSQ